MQKGVLPRTQACQVVLRMPVAGYRHGYAESWENEGGVEWHPEVDSTDTEDSWKKKFNVESKVKSSPATKTKNDLKEEDEVKVHFGLRYRYDFWELW